MAYPNNPLFDLLRALAPQQANQQANAEQPSTAQPQAPGAEATGAPEQPPHPFAAFAPFFAFPQHSQHPHHHGGGRRGGPGRRCGPAMNPEARGPLDAEAEGHGSHHGPHHGRHHGGRHGRGCWGREPPAYAAFGGQGVPFDISAFVNSLASHPIGGAEDLC